MKSAAHYALRYNLLICLMFGQIARALAPSDSAGSTQCNKNLESWQSLEGPLAFPDNTKSLLSKHLTSEVWDTLKDKADSTGFTFKQAVFSGCKNTDSGIGVYAGSQDSYTAFADLMNPIIESYHGHKAGAPHESNINYLDLKTTPFLLEDERMIKSTRIRVGRNLADYPLGPGLTREQRLEIETKVVEALNGFDGELEGQYYSLSDMTEEV